MLLIAVIMSCQEETAPLQQKTTALLEWTGDGAVSGCGFFLKIDGQEYKPENETIIPLSFREGAPHEVIITYNRPNAEIKYACGPGVDAYGDALRLSSIRKKE